MAHTRGPWRLDNLGPRIRRFHVFGPNCEGIADVFYSPDDALLIAAAPDLLAALGACVEALEDYPQYDNPDDPPSLDAKALYMARAAIAKAEPTPPGLTAAQPGATERGMRR